MNEFFLCDIADIETPLAFELKADVFGLSVSYESPDDVGSAVRRKSPAMGGASEINSILPGSLYSNAADREQFSENVMRDFIEKMEDKVQMTMITFPSCVINKPSSQKFILRNLSGIRTSFDFRAITFEPPPQLNQKTPFGGS
jgi:hypothetical protein